MPKKHASAPDFQASLVDYYSFRLGFDGSSSRRWTLDDVKIPAADLVEAITIHYVGIQFRKGRRAHWYGMEKKLEIPSRSYVKMVYRQVIQYERIYRPRWGYTLHQFRKVRIWNNHDFIQQF